MADENILRVLQDKWIETEKNRDLSHITDDTICRDNDQCCTNCDAAAVSCKALPMCQYELDFESFYFDSFVHLQQSVVADDDSANKNTMGEWLNHMISNFVPSCSHCSTRAGKVTGMFLALFTVPEIIAQIYNFSKLTHLCNQALDAILESQIQKEKQVDAIYSAPLSDFTSLTVMAQDKSIGNSEHLYGAVDFTVPKQISLKSYYLFTTIVTVDRQAISVLPDVLQIDHFPIFKLIAPCWAQALNAQYFTVSSELLSGAHGLTLSQHVQKILAVPNDCNHCQSFSTIEDVTRYHLRHGQSFLGVSRDFAVSVHL
jgi:hypothetical protein